jgi:basic membrane protein A and related proteins
MHDHTGGGSWSGRVKRRGLRAAAGFGALSLVTAGIFVGAGAAGAQTRHATKGKSILACEVTDTGGLNDKSFNASAYAGLLSAVAHPPKGVKINHKVASSHVTSDYVTYINGFIKDKCNIIVTVGFLMADATWNAAVTHSSVHFAIVDNTNGNPGNPGDLDPSKKTAANIDGLTYDTNQDAFLGGYEAAATSKTGTVATYGGEQFPSVTIYMDGFAQGIAYYNAHKAASAKTVKLLGWDEATQSGTFIGSFTDPNTANVDSTNFLNSGASTIFPVAGGDGAGTDSAVKTWNSSHPSQQANVEWVDTNGCVSDSGNCSLYISSVTKGVTASVKAAVLTAAAGKFKGGNYVGTIKNGGAAFIENAKYKPAVPAAVLNEIKVLSTDIQKGTIKVKT